MKKCKDFKVYVCNYDRFIEWGLSDAGACIVVANVQDEALEVVLNNYNSTKSEEWTIEEIDTTTQGCYEIY